MWHYALRRKSDYSSLDEAILDVCRVSRTSLADGQIGASVTPTMLACSGTLPDVVKLSIPDGGDATTDGVPIVITGQQCLANKLPHVVGCPFTDRDPPGVDPESNGGDYWQLDFWIPE